MTEPSSASARSASGSGRCLEFGPFSFDPEGLLLFRDGQQVPLPPKAAGVLGALLERPGHVVGKEELLDRVWGEGTVVADRSLSEAVGIVRQALEDDAQEPTYVHTVHRRGYRFVAPVAVGEPPAGEPSRAPDDRGSRPASAARWAILAGVIAVAVVVAGLIWLGERPAEGGPDSRRRARRVVVSLPEEAPLRAGRAYPFAPSLAISGDGTRIAYVSLAADQREPRLFVKTLDRFGPTAVIGTERGAVPFFSPDGEWLGFLNDAVNKVRIDGGTPIRIAPVGVPWGATWGGDAIYFVQAASAGIFRVGADGGDAVPVTSLDRAANEEDHVWPQLLPDGDNLLFAIMAESDDPAQDRIEILSLDTGERKTVVRGSAYGRYVPSGHLIYLRDDSLWGRTFDLESLAAGDREVRLLESDAIGQSISASRLAVSDEGTLVLASRQQFANVVSLPRDGDVVRLPVGDRFCRMPRFDPAGRRIAFTCTTDGESDIWVLDLERGTMSRLTTSGSGLSPVWSPDGRRIAYGLRAGDSWRIEWKTVDGIMPSERILESEHPVFPQSWFPDGGRLVFLELHGDTGEDIWGVSMTDGTREPLVVTDTDESGPRVSPDGRWLAYHSFESGDWHVYVSRLDEPESRVQVSSVGGGWPVWSRDGTELLYYSGDFWLVEMGPGPELAPEKPRLLRQPRTPILGDRKGAVFDLSTDGQRIVAVEYGELPTTHLFVIFDWFSELEALLPTR